MGRLNQNIDLTIISDKTLKYTDSNIGSQLLLLTSKSYTIRCTLLNITPNILTGNIKEFYNSALLR